MQLHTSNGKDWISLKSMLPLLQVNCVSGFSLKLMSDLDVISRAIRQIVWWNIANCLLWQIPMFFVFLISKYILCVFVFFFLFLIMAPCYGWFNCLKAREPLWGGSLLFTTTFPEIPGTHLMNLRRMKDSVDLEPPNGFEHGTPGLGI